MNQTQKISFFTVFSLTLLLGFAIDIMVPSLPSITANFNQDNHSGSLIVSAYLISYALTQLFSGYISDVVGRKWLCSVGALLFSLSLYLCTLVHSFEWLIVLRVFQGICAGFFGVTGRAILADVFEGKELNKHFATMGLVWAMGPIIAPFIGGHLQTWFGWQSVFIALAVLSGLLAVMITMLQPETIRQRISFNVDTVVESYSYVLTKDQFIKLTIAAGMIYAVITSYNVFATYIFQQDFQKSADFYGQISLLMGLSWLFGQLVYRWLLANDKWHKSSLYIVYICGIFSGIFLSISYLISGAQIWLLILLPAICFFMASIIYIHTFVYAFSIVSKRAGTASSLVGSLSAFVAGAVPAITAKLPFSPEVLLIASMIILFLGNYWLNRTSIQQRYPKK